MHYAHFRAMAYAAAKRRRSMSLVRNVARELAEVLTDVLGVFCTSPGDAATEWALGEYVQDAIARALNWQDDAHNAHLPFRYRALCPGDLPLEQVERGRLPQGTRPGSENHEHLERGVQVAFGLGASRSNGPTKVMHRPHVL